MVKHVFISLGMSCSCELKPTMIRSPMFTAMNTLRARSTKSVGCASERAKPISDGSTPAECSWKSRDAFFNPFSAFVRHHTMSLFVKSFRWFHVHWFAIKQGRGHDSGADVTGHKVRSLSGVWADETRVTSIQTNSGTTPCSLHVFPRVRADVLLQNIVASFSNEE